MKKKLKTISSKRELADSLSLYNYKLPFSVAEYFCFIYRNNITCTKNINYSLFRPFLPYRKETKYIFGNIVDSNTFLNNHTDEYSDVLLVKLIGVEVLIPKKKEEDFMERYSNFVFSSSSDSGIEWVDDEDEKTPEFNSEVYYGVCRILF